MLRSVNIQLKGRNAQTQLHHCANFVHELLTDNASSTKSGKLLNNMFTKKNTNVFQILGKRGRSRVRGRTSRWANQFLMKCPLFFLTVAYTKSGHMGFCQNKSWWSASTTFFAAIFVFCCVYVTIANVRIETMSISDSALNACELIVPCLCMQHTTAFSVVGRRSKTQMCIFLTVNCFFA